MSTITVPSFRKAAEATATKIIDEANKAEKKQSKWALMPIADFPDDIQAIVRDWIAVELQMKAYREQALAEINDKCDDTGKRLVLTLGREVSPNMTHVLYMWDDKPRGGARLSSWADLVAGR